MWETHRAWRVSRSLPPKTAITVGIGDHDPRNGRSGYAGIGDQDETEWAVRMRRNTHLSGRPRRAQPDGQGRDGTPSPAGLNRITMHLLDGAGDVRSLSSTTCLKSVTLQGNIGRAEDQAWRLHLHRPQERSSVTARPRLSERKAHREMGSGEQDGDEGKASAKLLELIEQLDAEGRL